MKNNLTDSENIFEKTKNIDAEGIEFWSSRDLSKILGYSEYRHFLPVINRAKESCKNSKQKISDHFEDIHEMVDLGSGAQREVPSVALTRYACYLIVQNADPSKEIVAQGQTYFAIQTRRQELSEDEKFQQLKEDEKRVFLRNELKEHNKQLVETAQGAGVETNVDFAIFQNHGYKGLYGGLDARAIHKKKDLKKSQHILDHMGSTELAANLFRATQTEEKIRREKIKGKFKANQAHYEVGRKVRETIKEIGGTMPEDLPKVDQSVKSLEQKKQKNLKNSQENS